MENWYAPVTMTGRRVWTCAPAAVAKHRSCKGEGQKDRRATVDGPGPSGAESDCTVCRCCCTEVDCCCFHPQSEGCHRVGWSNTAVASGATTRSDGWVGRGVPRPRDRGRMGEAVAKGSWEGRLPSEGDAEIVGRVRRRRRGWMLLNLTTSGKGERERPSSSRQVVTDTVSRKGEGQPIAGAGGYESSTRASDWEPGGEHSGVLQRCRRL